MYFKRSFSENFWVESCLFVGGEIFKLDDLEIWIKNLLLKKLKKKKIVSNMWITN